MIVVICSTARTAMVTGGALRRAMLQALTTVTSTTSVPAFTGAAPTRVLVILSGWLGIIDYFAICLFSFAFHLIATCTELHRSGRGAIFSKMSNCNDLLGCKETCDL